MKPAAQAKRPWKIVRTGDGTVVDELYGTPQQAGEYASAWTEVEGWRHEARRVTRKITEVAS